jgi:hypothetical protein
MRVGLAASGPVSSLISISSLRNAAEPKQRQEQKQIPFGDDNQIDNGKNRQRQKQAVAKTGNDSQK